MRVLLSAYACEPIGGSEPGLGWAWVQESTKSAHSVTVLTRKNNQKVIERYFESHSKPDNLFIIYYDLPKKYMFIKRFFGIYLYYLLWQLGAYFLVKEHHRRNPFDKVHHVTFATIRQPSFMGALNIPFVYGPVGGGESPPYHLVKSLPFKAKFKEIIRSVANYLVKFDPLMRQTFAKANQIVVTSEQTKALIPKRFQSKVRIKLAIAQHKKNCGDETPKAVPVNDIKLLFVGRFEYWKGVHLCIKSLLYIRDINEGKTVTLTLVGDGPYTEDLKRLAKELGVSDMLTWVPWLSQDELQIYYKSHHIFLFPSFHDSGGMVVLEAMQAGSPVVCLNLGGPATTVTKGSGIVIDANLTEVDICKSIAKSILLIAREEDYLAYSNAALHRVSELTWARLVNSLLD